jgi:hypothetical protein
VTDKVLSRPVWGAGVDAVVVSASLPPQAANTNASEAASSDHLFFKM